MPPGLLAWAQLLGIIAALFGGAMAIQTFRLNTRTNKSKFVLDLSEIFLKDSELKTFWYRLDYDGPLSWKFDLSDFRHSAEERYLDSLLHRCAVVGQLLRSKSVHARDLANIYPVIRQIFCNEQVREYLRFNMLDFWRVAGHVQPHWPDAHYLYEQLLRWHIKEGIAKQKELDEYICFARELRQLPRDSELRKEVAGRINYDRSLPDEGDILLDGRS